MLRLIKIFSVFCFKICTPNGTEDAFSKILNARQFFLDSLDEILSRFPSTDRFVGEIPESWPKTKKSANKIYSAFSDFASSTYCDSSSLIETKETEKLKQQLKNVLNLPVDIKYIASGQYGKVFKITANNESFALKIFHSNAAPDLYYGKNFEVSAALFVKQNAKKEKYAEFYMGKIASNTDNDGFMLTKFIEKDLSYKQKIKPETDIVKYTDTHDSNSINGIIIDYGGIRINEDFKKQNYKIFP